MLKNNEILISVVMPTHNTPIEWLQSAVESILSQTYSNFEFIIIDDCSDNDTILYLRQLDDARIKIIHNTNNLGITVSLNKGFALSKGKYIARMDSDDIALPERLEEQLQFLEKNNNVIVCGTWIKAFGIAHYTLKRVIPAKKYYHCSFVFGNSYGLSHPTAFFRSSMLHENCIKYDESLPTAQDYDMWVRCSEYGDVANVEKILLYYRVHSFQTSIKKRELQIECTKKIQYKLLKKIFGFVDNEMLEKHTLACMKKGISKESVQWFYDLAEANKKTNVFDSFHFEKYTKNLIKSKIKQQIMDKRNLKTNFFIFRAMPLKIKFWALVYLLQKIFLFLYRRIQFFTNKHVINP